MNDILILTLYNTDCLCSIHNDRNFIYLLLFLVGLSIAPLSVSDRKEVMSIAHRWCLEDFDVVAFAYTPVHNSVRTISGLVYHTVLKKNLILLYPLLTLSTHATLLHGPHTFLQVEIFFQMPTGTFFSSPFQRQCL